MVVKTFRGILNDGEQERIRLQTIKGKVGYKIIKFQTTLKNWGTVTAESVMKVYKKEVTTVDGLIDFTDSDLLASNSFSYNSSGNIAGDQSVIIFDNQIFNQDIYITNDVDSDTPVNYYLELEVIPLDDAGAEYTTLKDMRQA